MSDAGAPRAVDLLIDGGDVVTMDEAGTVVRDGAIAVSGGAIAWIGPREEGRRRFRAAATVDAGGRLVLPGLVDAHFHTAQQLLRGTLAALGRRRRLKIPIWKNYYIPFEALLTPEDVYLSGLVAYTDMISVGTTCFAEAGGPHPDEMGRAALEVGLRGFVALNTVDTGRDIPPAMMMTAAEALKRNVELVERWRGQGRVQAWLALRQIIVCTTGLVRDIGAAARDLDVKIHTHLCEGTYEIDYALEHFGRRPAEYLEEIGVLDHRLHAAHSVLLAPEEVELYVRRRVSAAHCAFNNYAIGPPRLVEMWRRGIDVGLGTDGAASWGPLDIFQVAHVARVGQQAVFGTPWHIRGNMASEELLAVATRGGARALGLGQEIGSLEVGKRADVLVVDRDALDQGPDGDPLFVAACAVTGRDVRTVVVDGRVVMKDREMLTVDVEAVRARLAARRPALMERFEASVA
jgi:5-methylthioadenosine/S-adenosylhomocysteine deaminase